MQPSNTSMKQSALGTTRHHPHGRPFVPVTRHTPQLNLFQMHKWKQHRYIQQNSGGKQACSKGVVVSLWFALFVLLTTSASCMIRVRHNTCCNDTCLLLNKGHFDIVGKANKHERPALEDAIERQASDNAVALRRPILARGAHFLAIPDSAHDVCNTSSIHNEWSG